MANLRTKTAKWFEVTAAVDRMQDDGSEKKVKEVYVVDALTCTEAEARVVDEVLECVPECIKIQLLPAAEFVFETEEPAELWYKVKLQFITADEKSGKEKRTSQYMYVQAKDLSTARIHVVDIFKDTVMDYSIVAISETNILEVFEHTVEDKA